MLLSVVISPSQGSRVMVQREQQLPVVEVRHPSVDLIDADQRGVRLEVRQNLNDRIREVVIEREQPRHPRPPVPLRRRAQAEGCALAAARDRARRQSPCGSTLGIQPVNLRLRQPATASAPRACDSRRVCATCGEPPSFPGTIRSRGRGAWRSGPREPSEASNGVGDVEQIVLGRAGEPALTVRRLRRSGSVKDDDVAAAIHRARQGPMSSLHKPQVKLGELL